LPAFWRGIRKFFGPAAASETADVYVREAARLLLKTKDAVGAFSRSNDFLAGDF
jgi:hypothetical protein